MPGKAIPEYLLAEAQGVVIVPNVIKIGFIAGVRRGHGVVMVRDAEGEWSLPQFVTLTGGSVGWQAGIQGTDVVLVFTTRKGVQGLMQGKFTIGADASVSAGPVGRNAAAGTDATLKSEILSYSRSRGLFLGVAIDGSVLEIDGVAHAAYYGSPTSELPRQVPDSAIKLRQFLVDSCAAGAHCGSRRRTGGSRRPCAGPAWCRFRRPRVRRPGCVAGQPARGRAPGARSKRAAVASHLEARVAGVSGAAQGSLRRRRRAARCDGGHALRVTSAFRVGTNISNCRSGPSSKRRSTCCGNTAARRRPPRRPRSTCRHRRRHAYTGAPSLSGVRHAADGFNRHLSPPVRLRMYSGSRAFDMQVS